MSLRCAGLIRWADANASLPHGRCCSRRPQLGARVSDVRFLFFADTQLGCYATFSGMTPSQVEEYAARGMQVAPVPRVEGFEWDARQYELAIEAANEIRPDFVVIGGDMIDDLDSRSQIAEFFRISNQLDDAIPFRWVPGNHDIALDGAIPTAESIERYRATFGDDYYSFEHGPAVFVVMNTVVAAHPELVSGEWEAQLDFLRDVLGGARSDGDRSVVLLGHHPLFARSADEPDSYWNVPRERRAIILELLHASGVRVAFAGHWHRNAIAWDGEFQMVTSGPVGYPLGNDPSGYRVVDITAGAVSHEYRPLAE